MTHRKIYHSLYNDITRIKKPETMASGFCFLSMLSMLLIQCYQSHRLLIRL